MFTSVILFDLVTVIMFMLIVGTCISHIVKSLSERKKNNNSPRLTVNASVVAKRTAVMHHNHANAGDATGMHGFSTTSSTTYYVTFEVESGDRMEFNVDGSEYGMLVEGDAGMLYFQGTRYLQFMRL